MQAANYPPAYLGTKAEPTTSLLGKVLGIIAIGFLITAVGAYLGAALPLGDAMVLGFTNLVLIFTIREAANNQTLQLGLFYLFSAIEGAVIGPMLKASIHTLGPHVVLDAALITGLGTAVLAGIVYLTSIDYTKLAGVGFALLIGLLIVMVISLFVHFLQPTTLDWLVLGVFTILTLVDFGRIKAGGQGETAVELALSIYLDSLNIFLAVLDLLGISISKG